MANQINKTSILLLLVFVGSYSLALGTEGTTGPNPHLVVPERVYDFGSVLVGADIRHDFILENQGEGVLKISSVKPD